MKWRFAAPRQGGFTVKTMLFLYNPTSGKGIIAARLADVLEIFTRRGYLVTVYPTQCKGDATQIAQKLGASYDRVVCCGGDGTLSETVRGMMALEHPSPLGFLPVGSTNDCAATLHIPNDIDEAACVCAEGTPRPIDVGFLCGKSFVYVAAFGALTHVAYETPQDLKNTFGFFAYIMAGIAAIPAIVPYHLSIEHDGGVLEDDFYFGMVCNTVSVAGMKMIPAQEVALDDGAFEAVFVRRSVSVADMSAVLGAIFWQARPTNKSDAIVTMHTSHLRVTSDRPVHWTLDGEHGGSWKVSELENRNRALEMVQGE